MQKILLKDFFNLTKGEETDSFEELKAWVKNGDLVICFSTTGGRTFRSNFLIGVDVKAKIFETYSGSIYCVVAMDKDVVKVESIGYVVNDNEIKFDLAEIREIVSKGVDVRCKYMSTQNGHVIDTRKIISVDADNNLFITEKGKIYSVIV